jgi:ABC-type uncharacterized transport system involved in gliding motility auxiliary subunit
MKTTHPITRAAFGVAALVVIALLANWLVTLTPAGNHGADFTENKTHTLSAGTRAILTELDTPVVLRYYATRESNYLPEQLKLHMRRVDDLLKEYATLSKGKLRVENLDPQPDTDAEDSANLDGINGQRINEQNLYFGIAISCLDKTSVLPFLNPGEETMLEYQLSKAIGDVSTATKPKIGIMSALNLQGSPAMMPGQPSAPSWIIYQQLKQSFEIVDISMEAVTIDPKQIKVLLLFHPAGITPAAEYSVDQYLLHGGTVVACLDPYSIAAKTTSSGVGNPMMGGQPQPNPTTSTLPTLLSAWGVSFESGQVLADPTLATKLGGGRESFAVLTLGQEMMPQKDNVITKDLASVTFFLPGAFTKTGAAGITADTLLKVSETAGFVDGEKASNLDPTLARKMKSNGTAYDLVTHLTGKFKTAFPDGKPKPPAETPPDKDAPKSEHLKEASEDGNVFLIGDIDAFYDSFAYSSQQIGNSKVASSVNGNSSLLFNLLDQTTGSKYLIGSRSRAAISRPFTVIQKMEADFHKTVGVKIEEFQAKQKAAEEKLSDLQTQKSRGNELYLSPAQEAEIKKLREEQVEYAKLIRGQEKELRREKDKLSANITLLNVAAMPALVVLIGFALFIKRRGATRAR